ncbi:MAG: tetratricopeptide repeat protein [Magnetococcales bacterium]|nr:tetratricopeptide repeat protein [Magnetococcales bacterium]
MTSDPSDPVQAMIQKTARLLQDPREPLVAQDITPLLQPLFQLLEQFPGHPRLHHLYGLALDRSGDTNRALHHVSRAIALEPGQVEPLRSLALLLKKKGKPQVAEARIKDAIALQPDHAELHFLLGDLCMDQGIMERAIASFSRAIDLDPEFSSAWVNLGLCRKAMGDFPAAQACFERALELDPDNALGHVNLALTLLLAGAYTRGFAEFEWRFRLPQGHPLPLEPPPGTPPWNGESLSGKKILVLAEQGYGDAIQFVRFIPNLHALGGQTLLAVPAPLESLFQEQQGLGRVQSTVRRDEKFDFFIPMMSLGRFFAPTPDTISGPIPYLEANRERAMAWERRLPPNRFRIGLVWAGKPLHANDPLRRRSLPAAALTPLFQEQDNLLFVSLQKESPTEVCFDLPPDRTVLDFGKELHDFADTAALMDRLDLIITIDTAAAHLAGALGKPVRVLLPLAPDWRWSMDRTSSPWYPTSRLYRQTRPNHWEEPVARLARDLKERP